MNMPVFPVAQQQSAPPGVSVDVLSIVIPCKNEAGNIGRLLDSLERQTVTLAGVTIYIADAGSTDGTLELLEARRQEGNLDIRVIPGGLPSYGRNRGASMSRSEYILFLDADVELLEDDFIEAVLRKANASNLDCVGTLVKSTVPGWRESVIWNALTVFMYAYPVLKPFCAGMCIFMRRSAFEQLGGFDERVILGEDVELTSQIHPGRFAVVRRHVLTSNRRFRKMGYLRTLRLYTAVRFSRKYRHGDHSYYFQ